MRNLSKKSNTFRYVTIFTLVSFFFLSVIPSQALAQGVLGLPQPGAMVNLSPSFHPALLRGIQIQPNDPLRFDFIVDTGETGLEGKAFEVEATKLIKYFLASLTIPEEQFWVNLSPYEKERIIADSLGETEMGRDLLAQDYVLKQLTATLVDPNSDLGKKFWERVYKKAYEMYGTTQMPANTFNKIWIIPDEAVVYEEGNIAFVGERHLKVMLEEDYLSLQSNAKREDLGVSKLQDEEMKKLAAVSSGVVRDVLVPEIEKEVNGGKLFANLRQIFDALILATWYKKTLKDSLLGQVYVDKNKTKGVDVDDKTIKDQIYQQYLESFKKGVFNMIKVEKDAVSGKNIPRKYFSGGITTGSSVLSIKKLVVKKIRFLGKEVRNLFMSFDEKGRMFKVGAGVGTSQGFPPRAPTLGERQEERYENLLASLPNATGENARTIFLQLAGRVVENPGEWWHRVALYMSNELFPSAVDALIMEADSLLKIKKELSSVQDYSRKNMPYVNNLTQQERKSGRAINQLLMILLRSIDIKTVSLVSDSDLDKLDQLKRNAPGEGILQGGEQEYLSGLIFRARNMNAQAELLKLKGLAGTYNRIGDSRQADPQKSAPTLKELQTRLLPYLEGINLNLAEALESWGDRDGFVLIELMLREEEGARVFNQAVGKQPAEEISTMTGEGLIRFLYDQGLSEHTSSEVRKAGSAIIERVKDILEENYPTLMSKGLYFKEVATNKGNALLLSSYHEEGSLMIYQDMSNEVDGQQNVVIQQIVKLLELPDEEEIGGVSGVKRYFINSRYNILFERNVNRTTDEDIKNVIDLFIKDKGRVASSGVSVTTNRVLRVLNTYALQKRGIERKIINLLSGPKAVFIFRSGQSSKEGGLFFYEGKNGISYIKRGRAYVVIPDFVSDPLSIIASRKTVKMNVSDLTEEKIREVIDEFLAEDSQKEQEFKKLKDELSQKDKEKMDSLIRGLLVFTEHCKEIEEDSGPLLVRTALSKEIDRIDGDLFTLHEGYQGFPQAQQKIDSARNIFKEFQTDLIGSLTLSNPKDTAFDRTMRSKSYVYNRAISNLRSLTGSSSLTFNQAKQWVLKILKEDANSRNPVFLEGEIERVSKVETILGLQVVSLRLLRDLDKMNAEDVQNPLGLINAKEALVDFRYAVREARNQKRGSVGSKQDYFNKKYSVMTRTEARDEILAIMNTIKERDPNNALAWRENRMEQQVGDFLTFHSLYNFASEFLDDAESDLKENPPETLEDEHLIYEVIVRLNNLLYSIEDQARQELGDELVEEDGLQGLTFANGRIADSADKASSGDIDLNADGTGQGTAGSAITLDQAKKMVMGEIARLKQPGNEGERTIFPDKIRNQSVVINKNGIAMLAFGGLIGQDQAPSTQYDFLEIASDLLVELSENLENPDKIIETLVSGKEIKIKDFVGNAKEIDIQSLTSRQQDVFRTVIAARAEKQTVGGIDLGQASSVLQIKRDGNGMVLPLNQQSLEFQNIQGFTPFIINVTTFNPAALLSQIESGGSEVASLDT
ncbi:MAG: hypothetical protein PHY73_00920 [Candidatus Omnitrophica bacterium]|nr:hypothetical protein [Candidatus Omnitrophota bacterium]